MPPASGGKARLDGKPRSTPAAADALPGHQGPGAQPAASSLGSVIPNPGPSEASTTTPQATPKAASTSATTPSSGATTPAPAPAITTPPERYPSQTRTDFSIPANKGRGERDHRAEVRASKAAAQKAEADRAKAAEQEREGALGRSLARAAFLEDQVADIQADLTESQAHARESLEKFEDMQQLHTAAVSDLEQKEKIIEMTKAQAGDTAGEPSVTSGDMALSIAQLTGELEETRARAEADADQLRARLADAELLRSATNLSNSQYTRAENERHLAKLYEIDQKNASVIEELTQQSDARVADALREQSEALAQRQASKVAEATDDLRKQLDDALGELAAGRTQGHDDTRNASAARHTAAVAATQARFSCPGRGGARASSRTTSFEMPPPSTPFSPVTPRPTSTSFSSAHTQSQRSSIKLNTPSRCTIKQLPSGSGAKDVDQLLTWSKTVKTELTASDATWCVYTAMSLTADTIDTQSTDQMSLNKIMASSMLLNAIVSALEKNPSCTTYLTDVMNKSVIDGIDPESYRCGFSAFRALTQSVNEYIDSHSANITTAKLQLMSQFNSPWGSWSLVEFDEREHAVETLRVKYTRQLRGEFDHHERSTLLAASCTDAPLRENVQKLIDHHSGSDGKVIDYMLIQKGIRDKLINYENQNALSRMISALPTTQRTINVKMAASSPYHQIDAPPALDVENEEEENDDESVTDPAKDDADPWYYIETFLASKDGRPSSASLVTCQVCKRAGKHGTGWSVFHNPDCFCSVDSNIREKIEKLPEKAQMTVNKKSLDILRAYVKAGSPKPPPGYDPSLSSPPSKPTNRQLIPAKTMTSSLAVQNDEYESDEETSAAGMRGDGYQRSLKSAYMTIPSIARQSSEELNDDYPRLSSPPSDDGSIRSEASHRHIAAKTVRIMQRSGPSGSPRDEKDGRVAYQSISREAMSSANSSTSSTSRLSPTDGTNFVPLSEIGDTSDGASPDTHDSLDSTTYVRPGKPKRPIAAAEPLNLVSDSTPEPSDDAEPDVEPIKSAVAHQRRAMRQMEACMPEEDDDDDDLGKFLFLDKDGPKIMKGIVTGPPVTRSDRNPPARKSPATPTPKATVDPNDIPGGVHHEYTPTVSPVKAKQSEIPSPAPIDDAAGHKSSEGESSVPITAELDEKIRLIEIARSQFQETVDSIIKVKSVDEAREKPNDAVYIVADSGAQNALSELSKKVESPTEHFERRRERMDAICNPKPGVRAGRNGGGRRSGAHIFQRCGCGCEAADREGGAWVRRTERRRMEEEKGGGGRRTEEERYA